MSALTHSFRSVWPRGTPKLSLTRSRSITDSFKGVIRAACHSVNQKAQSHRLGNQPSAFPAPTAYVGKGVEPEGTRPGCRHRGTSGDIRGHQGAARLGPAPVLQSSSPREAAAAVRPEEQQWEMHHGPGFPYYKLLPVHSKGHTTSRRLWPWRESSL